MMPVVHSSGARKIPAAARALCALALAASAALVQAASIHGVVTDATGSRVPGAKVVLISNQNVVGTAVSGSDGSFQIHSGGSGRYFLVVSAGSFRQLQTPDFYAGQFDTIERDVVMEPAWVRESIVVTATGTPTPQPQTSSSTTVLSPLDLALHAGLVDAMRQIPGASVVQTGQGGAQTALFIRGGNSDANKVLFDGVDAGDMGGQFNFGQISSTAVESVEVYRGPDSNLYGADAGSGVVSFTTPHGTTSFPSVLLQGDIGNFNSSRELLQVSGSHSKLDYLGAFNWLQTSNALPNDEFHVATTAANVGWQPMASTQIRGTLHYGVDATGVPNAWDFYGVADDATQKDQDLFLSASIDNQTTASLHNNVLYGATRKREQYTQWMPEGTCIPAGQCGGPGIAPTYSGANFFGNPVTISGANGYSASGQALLDYSWDDGSIYPSGDQLVSNRDQLVYQGDMRFTPHLVGLIGFRFENERGIDNDPAYFISESVNRTNYDYVASVHGDFKGRLFYTLGGGLERYELFGTQTPYRAGLSFYALRPHSGVFSGTRLLFNFGDSVREPKLTDQYGSLYSFMSQYATPAQIQEYHVTPLSAPSTRTYEGGVEQAFLSQHILFHVSYFHNEFGRELESVDTDLVPTLLPNLTPQLQQSLETFLKTNGAYSLTLNSQAFRAQGVEANVESGIGKSIFLRGGYTYLDSVIQSSFTSDNEALLGGYEPTYNGIPIGAYSPLKGARPFRRPPHSGYFNATYSVKKFTGIFTSSFASRSDDSTYLEYMDASGGNTLLLPNRNLDHGYADLGLGESYQILNWLTVYEQTNNLLSNQHMAPIGYPSLPLTVRTGLRIDLGLRRGR